MGKENSSYIKLPFAQTKHTAQHVACMNSDSHIHIESSRFTYKPVYF